MEDYTKTNSLQIAFLDFSTVGLDVRPTQDLAVTAAQPPRTALALRLGQEGAGLARPEALTPVELNKERL